MTKWIVSAPIANSDLSMNFVCYNVDELEDLLAEFPTQMWRRWARIVFTTR